MIQRYARFLGMAVAIVIGLCAVGWLPTQRLAGPQAPAAMVAGCTISLLSAGVCRVPADCRPCGHSTGPHAARVPGHDCQAGCGARAGYRGGAQRRICDVASAVLAGHGIHRIAPARSETGDSMIQEHATEHRPPRKRARSSTSFSIRSSSGRRTSVRSHLTARSRSFPIRSG